MAFNEHKRRLTTTPILKLPSFEETFEIEKIGFKKTPSIGLLDSTHILIRFYDEEDHQRAFARGVWNILGYDVKMAK